MRRMALILCLLLLAPVSGAWSLPELPTIEEEWVIVRDDGWTHADWVALRDDGLEPLRQISDTEVLVWGDHGTYQLDSVPVLRGQNADGYRVVLEPRLPSIAQMDILSMFEFEALQLAVANSALPTSFEIHGVDPVLFDSIPGVWWVEPLLETKARNSQASSIMESGSMDGHPGWGLGLNGSGVVIGVADSGIELDHACFSENGTGIGEVGVDHRKVVLVNTTIGDGDHSGQADYKHGTHIAGTLVCDLWNGDVSEGTSPSHGARVLFQDVVNESGWSEPTVDWLLAEAVANGAVIHSDSWGDDTEAYTLRSAEFDLWHREVPWSLAFIAPGNNPSKFYEPANARNVVSVGGTLSDNSTNLYSSSSKGPTEEGLRGNFIATPAVGITSASADGNLSSFNDDMRSSTGTSMSTPLGASITAVIQQMVQDGWFTEEGFVPSGPQLRVLLALSADSLPAGVAPDAEQGWGRPNLANLIDYDENSSANIWIHDSFMMNETIRMGLINEWLAANGSRPLEQVIESKWNGSDAQGPFLKQGENTSWNLTLIPGEDLEVILSFNQRPFGAVSDDLDVSVVLPNGTVIGSNESLEGTEHVHLLAADLIGIENVTVRVDAGLVGIGNYSGVLGSDGDMLGFALAVKGVIGEVIVPEPEPEPEPEPDENRLIIYSCYNTYTQNWTGEDRDECEGWGWVDDFYLILNYFDGTYAANGDYDAVYVDSIWYTGCLNRMRFAEDPDMDGVWGLERTNDTRDVCDSYIWAMYDGLVIQEVVEGCMDPMFPMNWNPSANVDDGSCGCTGTFANGVCTPPYVGGWWDIDTGTGGGGHSGTDVGWPAIDMSGMCIILCEPEEVILFCCLPSFGLIFFLNQRSLKPKEPGVKKKLSVPNEDELEEWLNRAEE